MPSDAVAREAGRWQGRPAVPLAQTRLCQRGAAFRRDVSATIVCSGLSLIGCFTFPAAARGRVVIDDLSRWTSTRRLGR